MAAIIITIASGCLAGVVYSGSRLFYLLHIHGRELKYKGLCMKSNLTKREHKWKVKFEKRKAKKQAKRWLREQAWRDDEENPANQ